MNPAAANLEQLRKRAKDLLRDLKAARPAALDRLAAQHPNPPMPARLADAQLVIAREHGFPSWPKLRAYVRRVAEHGPALRHAFEEDIDYYAERADGLLASATDGTAEAVAAFERWNAPLTRRGARTVVARDHGFGTWAALQEHVAGLDEVGLIDELLPAMGRVGPAAGAHRAFYRPHGGFPAWRASADPREVVDEALSWAARNGSVRAIERLHARGADLDAEVYRGTPLTWAASTGQAGAVRRLLELGADPDRRGTFGGPGHGRGVTALHLAAQSGHVEVIRVLLDAGADPTVRDALYDSPPAGWADHFGHPDAVELLTIR